MTIKSLFLKQSKGTRNVNDVTSKHFELFGTLCLRLFGLYLHCKLLATAHDGVTHRFLQGGNIISYVLLIYTSKRYLCAYNAHENTDFVAGRIDFVGTPVDAVLGCLSNYVAAFLEQHWNAIGVTMNV